MQTARSRWVRWSRVSFQGRKRNQTTTRPQPPVKKGYIRLGRAKHTFGEIVSFDLHVGLISEAGHREHIIDGIRTYPASALT